MAKWVVGPADAIVAVTIERVVSTELPTLSRPRPVAQVADPHHV